jgi:hypothetical protein
MLSFIWRHDFEHNDTQDTDIQRDNKYIASLSLMTLSIMALDPECFMLIVVNAEWH